jgi:hypothetical protein
LGDAAVRQGRLRNRFADSTIACAKSSTRFAQPLDNDMSEAVISMAYDLATSGGANSSCAPAWSVKGLFRAVLTELGYREIDQDPSCRFTVRGAC